MKAALKETADENYFSMSSIPSLTADDKWGKGGFAKEFLRAFLAGKRSG